MLVNVSAFTFHVSRFTFHNSRFHLINLPHLAFPLAASNGVMYRLHEVNKISARAHRETTFFIDIILLFNFTLIHGVKEEVIVFLNVILFP